jgi:hypothetical protein
MRVKMEPTPESLRTVARIVATDVRYRKNADAAVEKIADETVRLVKEVVESQNFNAVPLSPTYALRKRKQGLDPRVLIATKNYLRSFGTKKLGEMNWGVECDVLLAKRLEFGTSRMKPRMHWTPVMLAMHDAAPIMFAQEVFKDLFGGT